MKKGFTLAEVLITLGIIGVVAALTLPSLIQKQQEKETVVKLKKTYSVLSQAYLSAMNEYGTPDTWGLLDKDAENGSIKISDTFAKYLKVEKNCGYDDNCTNIKYKYLNGSPSATAVQYSNSRLRLTNGTILVFYIYDANCNVKRGELENICASIGLDTNGQKPPNTIGKDYFEFVMTKSTIIPNGSSNATGIFESACLSESASGFACAGWVLFNENMDYLHCKDLSWDGKHSCKD